MPFGQLWGFLAQTTPGDLPSWLIGGFGNAFIAGLWWIERGDRKAAEDRDRASTERVFEAVEKLARAVEALERRERRRGA